MKKGYLFCLTHALPSACLVDENGVIVQSHGGSDADDAISWFNHFNKGKGYDVEVIDQKLFERVLYKKESTDILREKHPEFADIFDKLIKARNESKRHTYKT